MVIEQLTLMDQYNKSQKIEESLADHLLNSIKNVKFLRTRLFYSDLSGADKTKVIEYVDESLYNMASLGFFMTRYYGKYRYKSLEYFKELIKTNKLITMTNPPEMEEIKDHCIRAIEDLNGLFRGNNRQFNQYSSTINKIIKNLEYIPPYLNE